jgi:hypothetical protein
MHYDYLRSPSSVDGLGGFAEDALATVIKQIGGGKTRWAAWNFFRFGKADVSDAEVDRRVAAHDVTAEFDAVFQGMKPLLYPLAFFTEPKDMKTEEKEAIHADLYRKWKDAWAQVAPKAPPAPPSADQLRKEAIAEAKIKAKAAMVDRIKAIRSKAAADAAAGTYSPPPAKPAPDYDTANYQAGWKAVKPLPVGTPDVVAAAAASAPDASGGAPAAPGGAPPSSGLPIVPILAVAGVVAFLFLRKKG